MTCHEVDERLAVYSLGALPQDERDAVDEHLRACAAHEASLRHLAGAVRLLHRDVEAVDPPAGLRGRVLAAVLEDGPSRVPAAAVPSPQAPPPQAPSRRLVFSPLVGVLAVLVAGLLAWNLVLQFGGSSADDSFVRYMRSEDDLHGWIYYVQEVGVITATGLETAGDRAYQAWALVDGDLVDLGVIPVSQNGEGYVLLDRHVGPRDPVFITVEPAGGSSVPTGSRVLTTERRSE